MRGEEEKRGKTGWRSDGVSKNGRDWTIDRDRSVKATSVHELTKNFCSILFVLKTILFFELYINLHNMNPSSKTLRVRNFEGLTLTLPLKRFDYIGFETV